MDVTVSETTSWPFTAASSATRAASSALVALLAFGCAEVPEVDQPQCVQSTECLSGRVCSFSYCVAPGDPTSTVHLQLWPPVESGLPVQHVADVPVSSSAVDITLLPAVTLSGTVFAATDPLMRGVAGTLSAHDGSDRRSASDTNSGDASRMATSHGSLLAR